MKTSHRTLALLAGASLATLGLAMPAAAAPVSEPGPSGHTGLVANDTLTICAIDTDPDAPDCTFGTIDLGGVGTTLVDVDTVAEGQIRQTAPAAPGNITLNIVNDGDAEIYAVATGTSSATAVINSAIMQTANAVGTAVLNIDNNGILLIDAIASSTGTIPDAFATIEPGILQDVTSTGAGDALANFTNDGTLTVLASANAISTGANSAIAGASINAGVSQIANAAGDIAGVSFTNNGAVAITANALASGVATASANAYVLGVNQSAVGGTANATFVNAATLTVAANATATGGATSAVANATASGLVQSVNGTVGGNAVATNSGTMTVTANAVAVAGNDAVSDNAGDAAMEDAGGDLTQNEVRIADHHGVAGFG